MIVPCPVCTRPNRVPAARLTDTARCAACKQALLPLSRPAAIDSEATFDELLQAARPPLLVDFWAQWCGPCRQVAPELDKLAQQQTGRLVIAKVDTDALPEVAGRFAIHAVPTLILFRGGREAQRLTGAHAARSIATQLGLGS